MLPCCYHHGPSLLGPNRLKIFLGFEIHISIECSLHSGGDWPIIMDILFTVKTLLICPPRFVKRLQHRHRSLAYGLSVLAQFIKGNSCDLSPPPLLQSISVSSLSAVCRPDPPMPQNLSAGQKSFLYDGLLTAITSDNAANRAFHPKSLQVRSFSLGACLLQVLFCLFLRRSEI